MASESNTGPVPLPTGLTVITHQRVGDRPLPPQVQAGERLTHILGTDDTFEDLRLTWLTPHGREALGGRPFGDGTPPGPTLDAERVPAGHGA
jgi:hypothetical protein